MFGARCRPRGTKIKARTVNYLDNHGEAVKTILTQHEEIERLRAALRQFVAACDTAPPVSLITEIGMACEAAREALK